MIRESELNPEYMENHRAPLWRFAKSPLAPTEQEQYYWALGDYLKNATKNDVVFPSYATKGFVDFNAVNKAGDEASKNMTGWVTNPVFRTLGKTDEIIRQKQAHQMYKIPVVNNVMERVRQDLEKKIQGNLQDAIDAKRIGLSEPSLRDYIEDGLAEKQPLEKQLIDSYLRSRFGN